MKKRILMSLRKQWLPIWLVVVCTALFTIIAFAEYPGTSNYMKRVVLSDDSSDRMFTSNLLTLIENNKITYQPCFVKPLTESDLESYYEVNVYIWNYDIDGSGDHYQRQIKYDLEISLVDAQGNVISNLDQGKSIRVFRNNETSAMALFQSSSSSYTYSTTENETLVGNARSQNRYRIQFSKNWDLENDSDIRVMMKATPTDDYPELKPLAAAMGLKKEQSSASLGWKYYINEQRLDSLAVPSEYDAYNLVLTGTGSKTIEIEWDPAKVALNKNFYESNGAFSFVSGEVVYTQGGGTQSGWDKLVIAADSYDPLKNFRNRYDIQLYKMNGELSGTWSFIGAEASGDICITINIPAES